MRICNRCFRLNKNGKSLHCTFCEEQVFIFPWTKTPHLVFPLDYIAGYSTWFWEDYKGIFNFQKPENFDYFNSGTKNRNLIKLYKSRIKKVHKLLKAEGLLK